MVQNGTAKDTQNIPGMIAASMSFDSWLHNARPSVCLWRIASHRWQSRSVQVETVTQNATTTAEGRVIGYSLPRGPRGHGFVSEPAMTRVRMFVIDATSIDSPPGDWSIGFKGPGVA